MKRKLLFILFFFMSAAICNAEDIYVSQSGGGDGSSCVSAQSAAWFNTSGNWGDGSGKISSGDTVHLCGTITSQLSAQGSGSSGSVITILFESGAKIQPSTFCNGSGCLNIANKSYMLIDGGTTCGYVNQTNTACNGQILNTTAKPTSSSFGIVADGAQNVEIRNMTIGPLYQAENDFVGGIDIRGIQNLGGSNGFPYLVHNNHIQYAASGIVYVPSGNNDNGFQAYNNWIENINSSVDISNNNNGTLTGALIHDNHFGSTAAWDYTGCPSHHNSLHAFSYTQTASGIKYYNNLVDGDWGTCSTAALFIEGSGSLISDSYIYNNYFNITQSTNLSGGLLSISSGGNTLISNNTLKSNLANNTGFWVDGTGTSSIVFENNIIDGVSSGQSFITKDLSKFSSIDFNVYSQARSVEVFAVCPSSCTYYNNLAAWQTVTGDEAHSLLSTNEAYAKLNSDGSLQSGSPAIDAGISLASYYDTDIINTSRPQGSAWDIGAYEYTGAEPTPTPTPIAGGGGLSGGWVSGGWVN